MMDEAGKISGNRLFPHFPGMLWNKYLDRNEGIELDGKERYEVVVV